jgi:hypothetical protein
MARLLHEKRKYQPWPGAFAAASELAVTYSHLRRVLAGERKSRSLLARYRALTAGKPKAAKEEPSPK